MELLKTVTETITTTKTTNIYTGFRLVGDGHYGFKLDCERLSDPDGRIYYYNDDLIAHGLPTCNIDVDHYEVRMEELIAIGKDGESLAYLDGRTWIGV